jgi:hypothetical protein
MKPIIGKWYWAEYGIGHVKGLCVNAFDDQCILKFRWGDSVSRRKGC